MRSRLCFRIMWRSVAFWLVQEDLENRGCPSVVLWNDL